MIIEEAMFKHLTQTAANVADLAPLIGNRVYPLKLPQEPMYPAAIYTRVSTPREQSHGQSSGGDHPRFQFDIFAQTHAETIAVKAAISEAMDGFQGEMGGTGGLQVDAVHLEDEDDEFDDADGDENAVYRARLDFVIWHQ